MFTIEQIKTAHAKVKTGADYPNYVSEIKQQGVEQYETLVTDGSTLYKGANGFSVNSDPKFEPIQIEAISNAEKFIAALKAHQQGQSDYFTFRKECGANGVEKWVADLDKMTCTYFDKAGNQMLVETIPS